METIPHPVGLRGDGVGALEERPDALGGEAIVLRPEDDAALPLGGIGGPSRGRNRPALPFRAHGGGPEGQRVALLELPAAEAAEPAAQIGRA